MMSDRSHVTDSQDALVEELSLDAETEMLNLRQGLMSQKIGRKHGRNCSGNHICKAIDVGGRKGSDNGRSAVAVGCRHMRVARIVRVRITATNHHFPSSVRVIGKANARREVELRQIRAALRYGFVPHSTNPFP